MGRADGFRPKHAEYVKGGTAPAHYPPEDRPEIAFIGKSNVGKSSLLNGLTARKALARTSRTPGRTQAIQFFSVDPGLYFADLPGYGYAKVPKAIKAGWGPMIRTYLETRDNLAAVIVIIDGRRDPGTKELELLDWLDERGRPVLIVASKMDKIPSNRRKSRIRELAGGLGLSPECVFPWSALSGAGRVDLWDALHGAADARRDEFE
jgi:GTP-binding protein